MRIIRKRHARKAAGFTFIELMIVLGIIAILAGGTVLSLFAYRGAQDLVFDTEGIVGVLRLAQEHAITGEAGAYWGVCFHGAPASPGYYELIKEAKENGFRG